LVSKSFSVAMSFPPPGSRWLRLWTLGTDANVALYRITRGRLGGRWKRRNPILLLEHVGRHSGKRRTTPVVYTPVGGELIVVASRGGSESNPGWYHNIRDGSDTWVQMGRHRFAVLAREADPAERESLWPRLVEANPDYVGYDRDTDRRLPVMVLRRREI
jgi:deazaflavin-dependent oxidoreductase (nitroreductase family)